VAQFLDIFGFISVILRGFALALEALTIGGVIFTTAIAFPRVPASVSDPLARWILRFSALLAITEVLTVAANSAVLVGSTDLSWKEVTGAGFWTAGGLVVFGSVSLGLFARTSLRRIVSPIACVCVLAGSVMESHAIARVDHRMILVASTAAHHLGAAAWIGGLFYLLVTLRRSPDRVAATATIQRFSKLAMASVTMLVGAGLALSLFYVGSLPALGGTTYGIMVLAKVSLTVLLLVLGALNFRIVSLTRKGLVPELLPLHRFGEAELGIGLTVLLAAASLTSTPPAIDVLADRVSSHDIAERMKPRLPRMETPSLREVEAAAPPADSARLLEASFVPGQKDSPESPADIAWSEYNHHWAGLVVFTIGALAFLSRWFRWARHWPLAFLGLAVFLFIRADAENWPLGPRGFWESFQVAEVAQHRVFVLLIVAFGVFEWAVQNQRIAIAWPRLVFPLVCAIGGALLMTHSHSLGNVKEEFLAELSHTPLALLAVLAGWCRWLEVRLPPNRGRATAWIWPVCFVLIGFVLINYRES
jgi:putative copper resistance protein D